MKKGFTLVELLAVMVVLAILSLIAIPIVLNVINNVKENSVIRSAELYVNAVEQEVMEKNMDMNGELVLDSCTVKNGNLNCNDNTINFEIIITGEPPKDGSIIKFNNIEITEIELLYDKSKVVMNEKGSLVYKVEEPDSKEKTEEEQDILITSLNVTYESCSETLQCIPNIEIEPSNATNKNLEFSINDYSYTSCGSTYSFKDNITLDSSTGIITKKVNYATMGSDAKIKVTVKTLDGSNITKEVSFVMYGGGGSCFF